LRELATGRQPIPVREAGRRNHNYIAAPGHSPSHATILLTSGQEQFMHMGDLAHNPVTSLQHPDWTPIFDYDPAQAIKSRKAFWAASRPRG